MRLAVHGLLLNLLFVGATFAQSGELVWLFDGMEGNVRWSRMAPSLDHTQGKSALMLISKAQGVTMAGRDNAGLQIDWEGWSCLMFDYKILGKNVTAVGCKVRYYPFHDGQQVVYFVPEDALSPDIWHTAALDLKTPSAIWSEGTSSQNREFSLRMHTSSADSAVVIFDNIRLTRDVLSREQRSPAVRRAADGGYEIEHSLDLRNPADSDLRIAVSIDSSDSPVLDFERRDQVLTLAAREERILSLLARLSAKDASAIPPLTRLILYARFTVEGIPELSRHLRLTAVLPMDLPSHPRLLMTPAMLPGILAKVQKYAWARSRYDRILREADTWLTKPVEIPDRGGQWPQWYVCAEHNVTLRTLSDTQHQCPVDGKVYTGEPYDSVVILRKHEALVAAARNLGMAYQFTGKLKYAEKCASILLGYAAKYRTYPLRDHLGNPSSAATRASWNSLGESNWAIPLIEGYDGIYDSGVLTAEQIERINRDIWQICAADIRKHDTGVHNFSCWHMAAIGEIGLCVGDVDLIDFAINGPRGIRRQISEGILDDGMWFEGSWGYHFYALQPILHLAEACAHAGIELYGDRLRGMFEAPQGMAMPDLSLPAFNDSGTGGNIREYANYWEKAYLHYRDPLFARMLRYSKRETDDALLFGVPELDGGDASVPTSRNYSSSGVGVLRRSFPEGEQYLALDYGPHGGGHGHLDKLGFVWYGLNQLLALDPGSVQYSLAIHEAWFRQTVAHNTMVVDIRSQAEAEGRLLGFRGDGDAPFVSAETSGAYPGVTLRRSMILTQVGPLLVDWAISESEHTCDWVYHGRGGFTTATALKPPDIFLGLREGYEQIENPYQSAPARSFQATWDLGDAKGWVHLALASDEPAILFTGLGYGFNAAEKLPLVIARRTGRQILWVSLLTSDMERQTQTAVRIERAAPELTRVRVQSLAAEWICEVAMVNGRTIVAWAPTAGSSPLSPLSTDFDSDGIIGFSDFFLFAERFGASHDEPIYDVRFDLDGDGRIGFEDFFLLARDFGRSALNLGSTGE